MSKYLITISFLPLLIFSCKTNSGSTSICSDCSDETIHTDSILIHISADNLSEDFGISSTKDDELIMIIYDYIDSTNLQAPILLERHIFTTTNNEKDLLHPRNQLEKGKKYLFVLLEDDSNKTSIEIELLFRENHQKLKEYHYTLNYKGIKETLGDDDIIGISSFSLPPSAKLHFTGNNLADRYSYFVFIYLP